MDSSAPRHVELQLRHFVSTAQSRSQLWLGGVVLTSITVAIIFVVLWILPFDSLDKGEALARLSSALVRSPSELLSLAAVVIGVAAQAVLILRARRLERVFLTDAGIRYQSSLPPWLQRLNPGWFLPWQEITAAYLKSRSGNPGPSDLQLVLVTAGGERKLRPFNWVDIADPNPEPMRDLTLKLGKLSDEALTALVAGTALVHFVAGRVRQFQMNTDPKRISVRFAFEDNRHALVAVIGLLGLLVYAIADFMLNHEVYATTPPYGLYVSVGISAVIVVWAWLDHANMPMTERTVVAVLFGAALGAAAYPGLLRLNQFTDVQGLQTYRYELNADLSLSPERTGLPTLVFPDHREYWDHFPRGSVHEFRLRKGALGFYQVDMDPVYARMRDWYRIHPR